ncbi:MAG: MBL fold metallo-hydrolase [Bacteroidales bacterium]|nr:MBL fold metallo-hydrolase [Bacteroidales bacterium]
MTQLKKFIFNPFQVNTYVLYDATKECVIIDPGCSDGKECNQLIAFLEDEELMPMHMLLTHTHIDHVVGCNMLEERLGLEPKAHKAGLPFLDHSTSTASTYGLKLDRNPEVKQFIDEGDNITFGKSSLEVLYTPGHASGSVCFYSKEDKFVIAGDVLFQMSIGRTDFPTGDYDLLKKSIFEKLFVLPDDTIVYSGHGPETSIGFEKANNPFLG